MSSHLKYCLIDASVELRKAHERAAECWVPHAVQVGGRAAHAAEPLVAGAAEPAIRPMKTRLQL